ncbi:exosome component 10-like [Protopterus annectens]|uniref:exosome component 10-like n=1 Tax=Protopterus annectens TaxID=7888 RepID=UPI001CFBD4A7|nr:exosome component 10-like [Protopterus annectens]
MVQYAREDTHYSLYIYDKMRVELLENGNEQPNLLLMVWQKSKELCLKKYTKPIFTETSYMDLYRKMKRQFNEQELTAFKLLYAWRDRMARTQDESVGYVLPNHMMLKIAEELPKEPPGILACCNPVPPLVRQQINELLQLIYQAREVPLIKSDTPGSEKKKGPAFRPEKRENPLFGPHDTSHLPVSDDHTLLQAEPLHRKSTLFPDLDKEDRAQRREHYVGSLIATAIVTIFGDKDDVTPKRSCLTVAHQKARNIMQSFDNPFRMFLPSKENKIHFPERAKFDPSSKIYEISNRWKLLSIEQLEIEAKQKENAKKAREALKKVKEARQKKEDDYRSSCQEVLSVRQRAALTETVQLNTKRERGQSEQGGDSPKPEKKKRPKPSQQHDVQEDSKPFTPFDYSQSDFKVFSGDDASRKSDQFDPNKQAVGAHSFKKAASGKKIHPPTGNKSMSYLPSKSDRGFKYS